MLQVKNNNINVYNKKNAFKQKTNATMPEKQLKRKEKGNISDALLISGGAAIGLPAYYVVENGTKGINARNIPKFALAVGAITFPLIFLNNTINKALNTNENKKSQQNVGKNIYNTLIGATILPSLMKLSEATKLTNPIDTTKNLVSKSKIKNFIGKNPYVCASILGAGTSFGFSLYNNYTEKNN